MIKKILIILAVIILVAPVALFFSIKLSPLSWHLLGPINEDNSLAMKGYDVVAYYQDGKAIAGDTSRGVRYNDTIWYFSSDENKLTFKTFPEKFVPQYGGYCATAVSSGITIDVDPNAWHIENGKLYFFFDDGARDDFIARINQGIIAQADEQWLENY